MNFMKRIMYTQNYINVKIWILFYENFYTKVLYIIDLSDFNFICYELIEGKPIKS